MRDRSVEATGAVLAAIAGPTPPPDGKEARRFRSWFEPSLFFLMGDAVSTAKGGQQTPNGHYNLERMLKGLVNRGGKVLLCGTCMDARGLRDTDIQEGCRRSSLDELTEATMAADRGLVF
ncbi:MAG: DsrE family protein [Deltaproteobacteria bacterium]|nr:DsrE family protein [Deltaproteobacteria bacterium]